MFNEFTTVRGELLNNACGVLLLTGESPEAEDANIDVWPTAAGVEPPELALLKRGAQISDI
jgi:hypothetical protein